MDETQRPEGHDSRGDVEQELAEERTALSRERTMLANERTLNSWLRTGLAMVVAGFTIGIVLGREGPVGPARGFGVLLIALGGLVCVIGLGRYRTLMLRFGPDHTSSAPLWLLELLVGFFLLAALLGAAFLLRWV